MPDDAPVAPLNVYGCSKAAAEMLMAQAVNSGRMRGGVMRFSTVYRGPRSAAGLAGEARSPSRPRDRRTSSASRGWRIMRRNSWTGRRERRWRKGWTVTRTLSGRACMHDAAG